MIKLVNAKADQIARLVDASIAAFESDVEFGAPAGESGPPGFNSIGWHKNMLSCSDGFFSFYVGDNLIGGALVFRDRNRTKKQYNLGRIWIDPEFQHQGYGLKAMELILDKFPDAECWTLETPSWNIRTRNFYLKAGFTCIKEARGELHFVKKMASEQTQQPAL
ncbi:MAG TPA: GNAT family N-acetyltransferase [Spirochaetota bacterium]|nr:GNAT family N-acetyltransferase [Spirochaetota bacterium]